MEFGPKKMVVMIIWLWYVKLSILKNQQPAQYVQTTINSC